MVPLFRDEHRKAMPPSPAALPLPALGRRSWGGHGQSRQGNGPLSVSMFRGAALKRVSSPEQLDTAVRVTLPRQWLALGALVLVVIAAVVWAVTASVPTTLSGPGYYLPVDGLEDVSSPIAGTVTSVAIAPGAQVTFGRLAMSVTPPGGDKAVDVPANITGVVTELAVGLGSFVQTGERLAL